MRSHVTQVWDQLITVGPHSGAHRVAFRAALSLTVPLVVLFAIGRIDLAPYAGFGAFASIYGRDVAPAPRIRMQFAAGVSVVLSMLIGTLLSYLSAPLMVGVVALTVIAVVVTAVAVRFHWGPGGAIFQLFGAGACLSLPATASTFGAVIGIGLGAVLFSLVVTTVLSVRRIRARDVFAPIDPVSLGTASAEVLLTTGIGVFLASTVAAVLVHGHWYWATVAAVAAVTGKDLHARLARGTLRFLGTAVGVALAACLFALQPPLLVLILIACLCQGAIELLVMRNYGLAMMLITVIALTMVHLASPEAPGALAFDRLVETTIGVVIGSLVTIGSSVVLARLKPAD